MQNSMKCVTLMYHDACLPGGFDRSGFDMPGADLYKMEVGVMRSHFAAIARRHREPPASIYELLAHRESHSEPLFLTFDDGGVSSATLIAPMLEEYRWPGHFFVTAGKIGHKNFLNEDQIRELDARGHVVGSHSWSHPTRMSQCTDAELRYEWSSSIELLSNILGKQVQVASVPGGYFSRRVGEIAADCGIRALFTSEPVKHAYYIEDCLVMGRYTLLRDMPPEMSPRLASERTSLNQMKQFSLWNTKKIVKAIGGDAYLMFRARVIGS